MIPKAGYDESQAGTGRKMAIQSRNMSKKYTDFIKLTDVH